MKTIIIILFLFTFNFARTQVVPEVIQIFPWYMCPIMCNWSNCSVHMPFYYKTQSNVDRNVKFKATFHKTCFSLDGNVGWNKLQKIEQTASDKNNLRLGWRTDQTNEVFEVGLYAHIDGKIESVRLDYHPPLGPTEFNWYYLRMAWHGMYARAGDNSYCIKRKIFEPGVEYLTDFIQGAYREPCPNWIMGIVVNLAAWDLNSDYWKEGENKGFCNSIFYSEEYYTVLADNSITAPLVNTNNGEKYTIIEAGADVSFIARKKIILDKGFTVKPGAHFVAMITGENGVLDTISNLFPPKSIKDSLLNQTCYKYEIDEAELDIDDLQPPIDKYIYIYPNPSPGTFNIELYDKDISGFTVEVTDMMGTRVYYKNNIEAGITEVDIKNEAKGIYFVKIQAGNKVWLEKVVYR